MKIIPKFQNGKAFYVNFPEYDVKAPNNSLKIKTLPLSHSAIVTVSPNGNTRYYQYGRYNPDIKNNIGKVTNNGNFQRIKIPNFNGNYQDFVNQLSKQFNQPVTLTVFPEVDHNKVIHYIDSASNNKNREPYSIINNNCATTAFDAIKYGQKKKSYVPSFIFTPRGISLYLSMFHNQYKSK